MNTKHFLNFILFGSQYPKWKRLFYILPLYIVCVLHYFPGILLHHALTYRNFTIHSSEQIDPAIKQVLDNSLVRLHRSEINDSSRQHHLYLCEGYWYAKFFGLRLYRAFAWNTSHKIFIVKTDAKKDECYRNDTDHNTVSLSETIAHEIVHSFQRDQLGWYGMTTMPTWKIEGYALYVSKNESFDLVKAKQEIQRYKNQSSFAADYGRYDISVLYLFRVKNFTFQKLEETPLSLEEVLTEIETL